MRNDGKRAWQDLNLSPGPGLQLAILLFIPADSHSACLPVCILYWSNSAPPSFDKESSGLEMSALFTPYRCCQNWWDFPAFSLLFPIPESTIIFSIPSAHVPLPQQLFTLVCRSSFFMPKMTRHNLTSPSLLSALCKQSLSFCCCICSWPVAHVTFPAVMSTCKTHSADISRFAFGQIVNQVIFKVFVSLLSQKKRTCWQMSIISCAFIFQEFPIILRYAGLLLLELH